MKVLRKGFFLFLGGACLSLTALPCLGQTTWTGSGGDDLWFNNNNWDTLLAPNGATADVVIGSPSPTELNGNVGINSLTIGSGGVLNFQNGRNLNFTGTATTTLTNSGAINLANSSIFMLRNNVNSSGTMTANYVSGFAESTFYVDAAGATLDGGGTMTLSGVNSRIRGDSGAVLTVNNQTINGDGNLGFNVVEINNLGGLIDANVGSNVLGFDSAGSTVNTGIMQASNGGILRITTSNIDNTGGLIQSLAGSTVEFNTAEITGGTVAGDGSVILNSTWTNVMHTGSAVANNNGILKVAGNLSNSGSFLANYTGGFTEAAMEVQSNATLDGGGTVTLSGANARIKGTGLLTINNQTVQGTGDVGFNVLEINNTGGLIDANVTGGTLFFDAGVAGASNSGVMQASNGGVLDIRSSDIDNSGGVIQSVSGGMVNFSTGSRIVNGEIAGAGGNVINGTSAQWESLTHSGTTNLGNSSSLGLTGLINNTGLIQTNYTSGFAESVVEIQSTGATLDGGGTINLSGVNGRIRGIATLDINDQTINGEGGLGFDQLQINNNAGLIDANVNGGTMVFDASAAGATNSSVMQATNGGTLEIFGSNIDNTGGVIQSSTGGLVKYHASSVITGGLISADGAIENGQSAEFASLDHSGTLDLANSSTLRIANTINNSGLIRANYVSGFAESVILVQPGGATLDGGGEIELNGVNGRIRGVETLTIGNQTISGNGNIGLNQTEILTSAGTILSGSLTVDGSAATFVNNGQIISDTGAFTVSDFMQNNGTIDILGSNQLNVSQSFQNSGILRGAGTVDLTGGGVTTFSSDGIISVGGDDEIGVLDIMGSGLVSTLNGGSLDIEIGMGGANDLIQFSGTNGLGISGVDLNVSLIDGYTPDAGTSFVILQHFGSTFTGEFANALDGGVLALADGSGTFDVDYVRANTGGFVSTVTLSNFQASAIPEPGAAFVIVVAMGGICCRRRRA